MFNITVLKMKDILKYMCGLIITLICIIILNQTINSNAKNNIFDEISQEISKITQKNMNDSLSQSISSFKLINKEEEGKEREVTEHEILKEMLSSQISSISGVENIIKEQKISQLDIEANKKTQEGQEKNKNIEEVSLAQTNVVTEVITKNPLKEVYQSKYGNVKIKNETAYELTQEILTPNITFDQKNILIFQTHSCESYTSSDKYTYTQTGNYRTTDLNYSVTRVGEELKNQLKEYELNAYHDKTYHDYPSYNGSYTNSLRTVKNLLSTTPTDIVFDVHRDAIGSTSSYAPTVKIGDEEAAQIMFVIGTNAGGLEHPNWQQNLKFAIKVQEKAEEMYPGLFKPIFLTKSRYNQHTAKYANIIEVGATGNTLEQSLASMKYLAKVLEEVIK